ncbi:MAG: EndoU domain-containing protein [Methylococcales bacterium]|nr:EndoU domain-containing protein [Methylococcales bacterium]
MPVVDVKHIFYGEIKNRTAKGFHSTALSSSVAGAGVSTVEQVLWKKLSGVYKAWVNVADTKTGRYRRKKSTMFPDSWSESYVSASLYLSWIKSRGKKKGTLNLGVIKIQYYVKDGIWLQGHPL